MRPARATQLRKSTQELLNSTREGREPNENLLLVVDQFEEIFRFRRDKQLSERDAAHFMDLLLAAEQDLSPEYRVYIVLTMRTDYLGDCGKFEGLPEVLNRCQYLVPRMTRQQTREAIEGPAALTETDIAPGLMQILLVESAEGRDTLPLLQHTLMRLWENRGARSWRRVADYFGTLFGSWRHGQGSERPRRRSVRVSQLRRTKRACEKNFSGANGGREGRDQRRPQCLSQLVRRTGAGLTEVAAVVEHFLAASFLSSPDRGRATDLEVRFRTRA